ncbi:hypothetical protein BS614_07525 [Paenibacillus xylanexedens]|uniref:hypothetical protein n=1 Tax=Paenibacillus xylanexedens TaxID=528191 RepID=UPI0009382D7F|nr:hypothetical protein [Paenibacillus xylanexedens]APO43873.1 hypothetical protein BS614_07525 [Paenibacillus xylanexedens]
MIINSKVGAGDYLLSLDLFDYSSLTDIEIKATKHVNKNVECIIRVLLDLLEDNNDFTPEDFLPYNNLRIDNDVWSKMVYDLYDIIRSDVIREYVKPKYEFLLYVILQWWDDCTDDSEDLLANKIDDNLAAEIKKTYTSEDGGNCVINAITDFEEYYYILFADHDFLPDSLERLLIIYIRSPERFTILFPDVDLNEYQDLMPKDLRERFEELKGNLSEPIKIIKKEVCEDTLLQDLIFCCEKLQASFSHKDSPENHRNDYIRDLLDAMGYSGNRDQTRLGTSSAGKEAGEVDILVRKDNRPFSIIEALNLSSVKKSNISLHIDKIYRYDTLGYICNFIVSYVKVTDFLSFWNRYVSFVQTYSYPFELVKFEIPKYNQHPELRFAVAELMRNNVATKLYHIVVHIPS